MVFVQYFKKPVIIFFVRNRAFNFLLYLGKLFILFILPGAHLPFLLGFLHFICVPLDLLKQLVLICLVLDIPAFK